MLDANNFQSLMSDRDVARITGLSLATVRRWRRFGLGPKYIKLGAAVRYKREDIAAWMDSRPAGGELLTERIGGMAQLQST